ncbi:MAG: phospholipid carrier-dependent glycosyltransferase [Candidatus Omnitrophica bacterium]|nr:phospholipid carrier-dependent glycosyltransferase [Candidatus Omnitrophota bacterium]
MFDKKLIIFLIFIILIILLRLPIFFLPHFNNDELIHLSLAMKMEKYGQNVFDGQRYNLFYIDRGISPDFTLAGVWEGKNKTGLLLQDFLGERGVLSHHPPLLPFFLKVSHKIFSNNQIYLVNISNRFYSMLTNLASQFYACVVPFLSSIFFILAVYILGSLLFSKRIGLYSAFFLSLTPTELMTANKIWADDMTAFFVTLAVIFYLYAFKNNKPFFSLLAGFSCGLSILSKMSGIYIVFVILLFHISEHKNKKVTVDNVKDFLFDRNILYFLAGIFITSAWWFNLYYSNFDIRWTKSYFTINEQWDAAKNWNMFFNTVSNRPWFSYFILVPFQFPLYSLSYILIPLFILRNKFKAVSSFIKSEEVIYLKFLIIWMAVVFVFLTLKPGKELRYMLIAYPAISILSVYCLNLFYERVEGVGMGFDSNLKRTIFICVILLSLFFSLKIALPRILFRADIIPIPL